MYHRNIDPLLLCNTVRPSLRVQPTLNSGLQLPPEIATRRNHSASIDPGDSEVGLTECNASS